MPQINQTELSTNINLNSIISELNCKECGGIVNLIEVDSKFCKKIWKCTNKGCITNKTY